MNEEVKIQCRCGCGREVKPKKPWHVFFSAKCKNNYYREMIHKGRAAVERQESN
jgi:hypothetical protein